MSEANKTQVGGTHYQNGDQHWDFAAEHSLGYYEGQITKYITRHRRKKGLEDAEKCLHFVTKLYELHVEKGHPHMWSPLHSERLLDYMTANDLSIEEAKVIALACRWRTAGDLLLLQEAVKTVIGRHYPAVVSA